MLQLVLAAKLFASDLIYDPNTGTCSGRIYALQEQGHDIGYMDPPNGFGWQECLSVIKGSPMAECEELLNFMLAPETFIAVAEGQSYPPALDPTKVELGDKITALPAFDPTGTPSNPTFADNALLHPVCHGSAWRYRCRRR